MAEPIVVGAVLYDPKVSVIWDIIRAFFEERGCPIDVVYYTSYELQVKALLEGHLDVAWNSPLAWVDAQRRAGGTCRAIAMRDTDRDRVSQWVVRVKRTGGHTRHHQMILIESGGRSAAFVADLIPTTVHVPDAWVMGFDLFPLETVAAKQAFVKQAIADETLVFFEHDPAIAAGVLRVRGGRTIVEPATSHQ